MAEPLRIYSGHDSGRHQSPILKNQVDRQRSRGRAILFAVASLVATFALFPLDATITSLGYSAAIGTLPTALIEATAPFATVGGVGLVAVAIAASSPLQSRRCIVLVTCVCLAGLTATCLRTVILRTSPSAVGQAAATGESPRLNVKASFTADGHCFPAPAGAIAIAAGLAFGHVFPRGRVVFLAIAVLSLSGHVLSGQHYPSDLTAGATVGCFSYLFWYQSRLAFTRVLPWINESERPSHAHRVSARRAA